MEREKDRELREKEVASKEKDRLERAREREIARNERAQRDQDRHDDKMILEENKFKLMEMVMKKKYSLDENEK